MVHRVVGRWDDVRYGGVVLEYPGVKKYYRLWDCYNSGNVLPVACEVPKAPEFQFSNSTTLA